MQLIDRQFLDTPFYGVRQMSWHLQNEGHGVNHRHKQVPGAPLAAPRKPVLIRYPVGHTTSADSA